MVEELMGNELERSPVNRNKWLRNATLIGETIGVLKIIRMETTKIGTDPFSKLSESENQARVRALELIDMQIDKLESWNG